MRKLFLVAVTAAALSSSYARAGDKEVGNGGDAVTLPDDSVILADPFTKRIGSPQNLHPALVTELKRVGRLLTRYGAMWNYRERHYNHGASAGHWSGVDYHDQAKFVEESVLDPLIEYRFVDALPKIRVCGSESDPDSLPSGSQLHAVACTQGVVTWIKESLFKRMTIREQAKLIIHERLHSLPTFIAHELIADLTDGIDLMLFFYNEQLNGRRPRLTLTQVETMRIMVKRIVQVGMQAGRFEEPHYFIDEWHILQNGGGLVSNSNTHVSPDSYVGIGSMLDAYGRMGAGAELIDSSCYDLYYTGDTTRHDVGVNVICELSENAAIRYSKLNLTYFSGTTGRFILGLGARIENSDLEIPLSNVRRPDNTPPLQMASGARISDSHLKNMGWIVLGANAMISGMDWYNLSSDVDATINSPAWLRVYPVPVVLGDNVELTDAKGFILSGHAYLTAPGIPRDEPILTFKSGLHLNFLGKSICSNSGGAPQSKLYLDHATTVSSLNDLSHLCE